jgi:hypothetical protein
MARAAIATELARCGDACGGASAHRLQCKAHESGAVRAVSADDEFGAARGAATTPADILIGGIHATIAPTYTNTAGVIPGASSCYPVE